MRAIHTSIVLCCLATSMLAPAQMAQALDDAPMPDADSLLFVDFSSVYDESKYRPKIASIPSRVSVVTADENQRYSLNLKTADRMRARVGGVVEQGATQVFQ